MHSSRKAKFTKPRNAWLKSFRVEHKIWIFITLHQKSQKRRINELLSIRWKFVVNNRYHEDCLLTWALKWRAMKDAERLILCYCPDLWAKTRAREPVINSWILYPRASVAGEVHSSWSRLWNCILFPVAQDVLVKRREVDGDAGEATSFITYCLHEREV